MRVLHISCNLAGSQHPTAIEILKSHLELLIDRYNAFRERRSPPVGEDPFSIQWTREAIEDVVDKAIGHVSQAGVWIDSTRARN